MGAEETTRKGPWTEQEDFQLVCAVGLLGERRWDFIAKVSGLSRTGKSCRLRWVNYLHPGLKHGRMTPQEERLVLELHSRWGNRWSRIARKLPGRTDNEIKNYWRTHMRKKAQERKRALSPSSSSLCHSSSCPTNPTAVEDSSSHEAVNQMGEMNNNSSSTGHSDITMQGEETSPEEEAKAYDSMEQIWKEIDSASTPAAGLMYHPVLDECSMNQGFNFPCTSIPSPAWNYDYYDSTWKEEEDLKLWVSMDDPSVS
ncbi:hypothetical protein ACLOJK_001688 [Asimina triloba]